MNKVVNTLKYYLLLCLALLATGSYSQNEAAKWHFGNLAGLDFMTNPPTTILSSSIVTSEGCAGISDAAGNLLFYTDGSTIWNSLNNIMTNGTGLNGNTSTTQSAVIVKQPGNANIYFVFSLACCGSTLKYSIVDMTQSGGLGSVTTANTQLTGTFSERLTSVKHCNGTDIWVLAQEYSTGNFKAYLVNATGVNATAVISTIGTNAATGQAYVGSMKLSPNGTKLGMSVANNASYGYELYDFDASTGIVSNRLYLTNNTNAYGCDFSPDGTKFYGMLWLGTKIYQWDLCAGSSTAIVASQYTIACTSGGGAQLAINGKIYMVHPSTSNLGVINNPNNAGAGMNYTDNGQSIAPRTNQYGLPNFITTGFKQPPPPFTFTVSNIYGCQTASFTAPAIAQTFSTLGCTASGYSLTGLQWNFGDPASGAANTSTVVNPFHIFSALGTYTTELVVYYSCGGGTDTIKAVVNINQSCITVTSSSISCSSLGTATVSNGPGSFSYTWMPTGQTGPVATGLSPGTYTVSVFDFGTNLTYTATTVLNPAVPMTGTVSNTSSVSCYGVNNGTANINVSNGSGSPIYFWTNGTSNYTVQSPTGMSPGNWSVTVADGLTGCTINDTFIITQPNALSLTVTASSPTSCVGGTVTLTGTVAGGAPGYAYLWAGGPSTSTYAASQTAQGNYVYYLNVKDTYSCNANGTVSVAYFPIPTITVVNASICPLQTATLVAMGANSYSWNGVAGNSTHTYNPVSNSVYNVTGNSQGCFSSATASITLKPVPSPTLTSNAPLCNGAMLQLAGSGGVSYKWSGPAAFNSTLQNPAINPVAGTNAGVYNLTVTAANSCTAPASSTIVVYPTPTISTIGSTVCTARSLSVSATSFTGATYFWTGPQGFTSSLQNATAANASANNAGVYNLTVTSVNGCTNTATASVTVVPPPNTNASLSSSSLCAQALSGSPNTITLTSSGASTYTLTTPSHISNPNPAGPSSPLSMLPPYLLTGPATATLYGSNGACTVSATVIFTIIPNPPVSISNPAPVICAGQNYTYTSAGASSYVWSWANPGSTLYVTGNVAVASPTINSIFAVVGNSLGCNSAMQTSTLTVNPLPQVSINPNPAKVCLGNSVQLTVLGTGTSFSWTPGSYLDNTNSSVVNCTPPAMQSYQVVSSLNSCTNTALVTVSVVSLPIASIGAPQQSVCMNDMITLEGYGGNYFGWNGPANFATSGQSISFKAVSPAYSGIYTLTIIDENNCRNTATQQITVYDLPHGGFSSNMQGCVPFCPTLNFVPANGITPITTMNWQVNHVSFTGSNFNYCFNKPGDYLISGKLNDANNCANTVTAMVNVFPLPEADFSFTPDQPLENLDRVEFIDGSTGAVNYNWYFGTMNSVSSQKNPDFLFETAGNYPVALVVKNQWQCSDTIVKVVTVGPDFAVYVPNAFTPNDDGRNELFGPIIRGAKAYTFTVFDRWGEKIFETSTIGGGWDGSFKGKACQQGVYVWQLKVTFENLITDGDKQERSLSGSVLLYR